ncbi:MAG: hypothetical protein ACYSWP_18545 [Planctomycetota bacterium]|jgi:uncharacterized membrane protein
MKSLFNVIIVLLILALMITTVGATEEHTEDERIHQVESKRLQVQQIVDLKKKRAIDKQQRQIPTVHEQQKMETLLKILQPLQPNIPSQLLGRISGLSDFFGAQGGRVLVIPDEEVNVEQMVRLTEDMTVMSRILDKKIQSKSSPEIAYGGYLDDHFAGDASTKSIYLENYGAVFLARVVFPLLAPVDFNEPNKVDDTEDKLWRETKMELYDSEKFLHYVQKNREHRSGPDYDSQKVEALKTELIKALKHASNIRDLKANSQRVIITVIGGGTINNMSVTQINRNQVLVQDKHMKTMSIYAGLPTDIALGSRSVLTVWALKADIDRFAKGQIDFEDFRSKVRILMY